MSQRATQRHTPKPAWGRLRICRLGVQILLGAPPQNSLQLYALHVQVPFAKRLCATIPFSAPVLTDPGFPWGSPNSRIGTPMGAQAASGREPRQSASRDHIPIDVDADS